MASGTDFNGWLTAGGRGVLTVTAYDQDIRHFAKWFEATNREVFAVNMLNHFDLQAYRTWCLTVEQCSPATWNRRRIALRMLAAWGRASGRVAFDPTANVEGAEAEELAPRWLDAGAFGRLMRTVEGAVNGANTELRKRRAVRDGAMVALMAFAGLRVAEASGLARGDVELSERKGRVIVRLGKGQKYREVPLCADARRWLLAWLEIHPGGENLFVNDTGEPMSARAMQKRVMAIGVAARIEGLSPHDLRHTCAKRMVDAGRPLTEVAKILGHAKVTTTARYTQPGWNDLEEAVESIQLGSMKRKTK